ncbi:hypothetical protein RHSIM_Rhsim05G0055400 [Rhododendron simsii]|uniref:Uncharacterized protein n=1 Tax=Rhododendron simsii TaxID=118357 RepID=A0A834H8K0_RHOSS|nr:hypothetical protein RHSIM_Rhsim05G0055400 [Rhododendron simsii]
MATEQVDRAEPPPPSLGNDSDKSQGFAENLEYLAFWIERGAAAFLVLWSYWFPPNDWGRILFTAVSYLIISNSLYLVSLFSSLLPMAANRYDGNATEVAVTGAVTLVIATCVTIIETLRSRSLIVGLVSGIYIGVAVLGAAVEAEDEMNDKIDEEFTGQQEVKLEFSSKESKEEVQAKDEMKDKINEELTGQQKAKLDISLKESTEEVRRRSSCCSSEEFQSLEAKYHAKYENLLQKYFDKCHGWEEERSQLMKELGSARASSEIYRELLHGSDDF